jgi:hypothetical protein
LRAPGPAASDWRVTRAGTAHGVIGLHLDGEKPFEQRWDASVDLEVERQIGLNLCWAAVSKGVVEHYGGPIRRQCQYATTFLHQKKTCCRVGALPARCDLEHDLDSVLSHYGIYAPPPFRRPISTATLLRELERDRPVVALVRFATSAHALVITAIDAGNRRVRVSDPKFGPADLPLDVLQRGYGREGQWFYTILTRPPAGTRERPRVSLLRDRMHEDDREPFRIQRSRSDTLEIDFYDADPYRLADGTGLQTAERRSRETVRLDVFGGSDGELSLDRALTALRAEIEARLDRGFEIRLVRCFPYWLQALWFVDPSDPSHRSDHFIQVPPIPFYLDEGREYSAAALCDALVKVSPRVLPSIETNRNWIERLDRETAYQNEDG